MTCAICFNLILPGQPVNNHHQVYKSRGGKTTTPTHQACHRNLHSERGDFRAWGKLSALSRRWAFNLKNVRQHPAYDFDRQYYLALYAN